MTTRAATRCKLLEKFETYGWEPNPELSDDENYMDLVLIVTRCSQTKNGSMACILVQQPPSSTQTLYENIISVATNGPFYSEADSDVHAEVAALGYAARTGTVTENATAYITMPPCKRCLAALTVSGVKRIVSRLTPPTTITQACKRHGIEMVVTGNLKDQMARINQLIYGNPHGKKRAADDKEIESSTVRKQPKQQK